MITGVNHITLAVRDVDASYAFYVDTLGLTPVAKWPTGAYFTAGETWIAIVADEHARDATLPEYSHVAFSVSPAEYQALGKRIVESGAPIWQENWTEGDSLYFSDPNGHKLEIHTSDLKARLASAKLNPWPGLEMLD